MVSMRAVLFSEILLLLSTVVLAQDFLQRPPEEWTRSQTLQILEDSPWSRQIEIAPTPGRGNRGARRADQTVTRYTVRLYSAQPVRAAYVRLFQLLNGYDGLTEGGKAAFNERFAEAGKTDVDRIIVNLDVVTEGSSEQQADIEQRLKGLRMEELEKSVVLLTQSFGKVKLLDYYPPSPDGTGAKFVFPKVVASRPVVGPTDRQIGFQFVLPGTDHRIVHQWQVRDLFYQGKTTF